MNVEKMLKRASNGNLPYRYKQLLFFKKKVKDVPTIVNIPISIRQHRNGQISAKVLYDDAEIEYKQNVSAGWHVEYTVVLPDKRRRGLVMRKVLA